ncbi:MAG TPA: ferritin-like domain-containing protein [Nocardioidaceae bacterium]|nr:ferritin-like domain-containing protein [Nocardioidaceae bacterium]
MTPLEALQTTLAGEHAALYVYGVLGGRVSASDEPTLSSGLDTAYNIHRGRRDQLISMIRLVGAEPVVAEVSYDLPNPALSAPQLERAALVVEQRCTAVYADMVGSTARASRQWAIDALIESAVRQLGFGGETVPFPGAPELSRDDPRLGGTARR